MILYRYNREQRQEYSIGYYTYLTEYEVIKETPKGYWIIADYSKKFVLKGNNGKRYAYDTIEAALKAFKLRTTRCVGILKSQLKAAQGYLDHANSIDVTKEITRRNKLNENK